MLVGSNKIEFLSRDDIDDSKPKMAQLIQFSRPVVTLLKNYNIKSIRMNNVNASSLRPKSTSASHTFGNSQNLPHLPVPKLEDTLSKYIRTVRPFLNIDELMYTRELVENFKNAEGLKLQHFLEERAKLCENWLSDWWLDFAYLSFRAPVVIYTSPGQSLPIQQFHLKDDRVLYTATLILAALSYKKLIDSGKMPIDKMGKDPLDMNQYKKIFGTCRIPGTQMDSLEYNSHSDHIIVACNNHFYKLKVFNDCNETPSVDVLVKYLKEIVQQSMEKGPPIGILTTDDRNKWGSIYQHIISDPINSASIKDIQKSLFLVCLDDSMPLCETDKMITTSHQLIHGGGSRSNSANRWFDKTVQFIIGDDGIVGLTYEHSPSEGQPIAVMADYLDEFIRNNKCESSGTDSSAACPPIKLTFNIDNRIADAINTAAHNLDKLISNLDMASFQFGDFGKDFIKLQRLSPDSFIQIALQFAFYRLHNVPGAQYESAATRKYIHGRTETIRSCSEESISFAKTMLDNMCSAKEKVHALRHAIDMHKKYTVEALNGCGVDRHLLGLKLAALKIGEKMPALFEDVAYSRSMNWRVSTSQVATKCDAFMSYGPAVHDGYGCCYNPRVNNINFGISAFVDNEETSATQFRCALELSLKEMYQILATAMQKSKL